MLLNERMTYIYNTHCSEVIIVILIAVLLYKLMRTFYSSIFPLPPMLIRSIHYLLYLFIQLLHLVPHGAQVKQHLILPGYHVPGVLGPLLYVLPGVDTLAGDVVLGVHHRAHPLSNHGEPGHQVTGGRRDVDHLVGAPVTVLTASPVQQALGRHC